MFSPPETGPNAVSCPGSDVGVQDNYEKLKTLCIPTQLFVFQATLLLQTDAGGKNISINANL